MSVSSLGGEQGGMLHRRAIVPDRFGGVGAWHACRNSSVFCWSVVFPEIGGDGYFDQAG
jgi:hypothetical protein